MTEACLDLQQHKTQSCPLKNNAAAIETLAWHMLAQPTDIEETARLGTESHACGYYASRTALAAAEVVVLPYSLLLSPKTRQSIQLSLTEAIVIVDEAHNLPEALRALHSCRLTLPVIEAALGQLDAYVAKYANRLAGRNLQYLGQIRKFLVAVQKHLNKPKPNLMDRMVTAGELLIELKLDKLNVFKVLRYLDHSRLAQKLLGFMNQHRAKEAEPEHEQLLDGLSKHVSAMSIVQTFLEKIACTGKEGKFVTDLPKPGTRSQHPGLRYVLLHPAHFFENVLQEARALCLVGGTLRPLVHVAAELLGDEASILEQAAAADEKLHSTDQVSMKVVTPQLTAFTCDHVVPASNVLLQFLSTGAKGQALDFRHHSRTTPSVCDELGSVILQVCRTVPSGVVVFLPSYSYEAHLASHWRSSGVWEQLSKIKRIHREPTSSQNVEASLQAYARSAKKGAILFSVVGGKMSEGINFSNEMARCVMVVGLPYPDITDPELKEKMACMDNAGNKSITGQAYYQNLCMRAVNQSVGRAIRHAKDYAAILLVDCRYQEDARIWAGLPSWLRKSANRETRIKLPLQRRLQEMQAFFNLHEAMDV